jgi:alginate O-acetyltransferase complex protein AlgI
VFLASGLWHGASWSFVLWGAYHGVFLVLERAFLLKVYNKMGKLLSTIITFFFVMIGWVFFRVETLSDGFIYIKRMFAFNFVPNLYFEKQYYTMLIIASIFAFFVYTKFGQKIQDLVYHKEYTNSRHIGISILTIILLLISVSTITSSGFNPFIYFRF